MKDVIVGRADLADKITGNDGQLTQAQPLTLGNLMQVMRLLGLGLRYNVQTDTIVFVDEGEPVVGTDATEVVELCLRSVLKLAGINALTDLGPMLLALAKQDRFHPMRDWVMAQGGWDGKDRIGALAGTITTDTELWEVYLESWMVQVMEGVCGWAEPGAKPASLPHVLVLVGGQGIGKTHWLEAMGAGWLESEAELHLSSAGSKDHQIEVLKHPMAELAELDGIFRKSDVSHMKSFVSRMTDAIRAPYARKALPRTRMTSFCGSVNTAEFLNDPTGSRRFWPVSVGAIARDFEMDWGQLWAQAHALWSAGVGFNLSEEDERLRADEAVRRFTLRGEIEETLAAYWESHKHMVDKFCPMNRTEIMDMLGYRNQGPKNISATGIWLSDILGRHKTIDGKQRAWMFPRSADAHDSTLWKVPYLMDISNKPRS